MSCDKCQGEGHTPTGRENLGRMGEPCECRNSDNIEQSVANSAQTDPGGRPCDCRSRHKAQVSESELRVERCGGEDRLMRDDIDCAGDIMERDAGFAKVLAQHVHRIHELEAEAESLRADLRQEAELRERAVAEVERMKAHPIYTGFGDQLVRVARAAGVLSRKQNYEDCVDALISQRDRLLEFVRDYAMPGGRLECWQDADLPRGCGACIPCSARALLSDISAQGLKNAELSLEAKEGEGDE